MEASEYGILKIYASSTDKIGTKLLYEYVVELAKEKGLAGATVYRGVMGFGQSSTKITTSKFWELTEKLPVVIEITDSTKVLEGFFQAIRADLEAMQKGCMVVLEPAKILLMKSGKRES